MENFTPVSALLGGGLIGVAAVMLMYFNGRIAGISGILGGIVTGGAGDRLWRITFVLGLIAGPLLYLLIEGMPEISFPVSNYMLAIAGVLVGVGTQLGNGCTSGHGVCGNARFSLRSLIATLSFMLTGVITVYIVRHVMGA